MWFSRCDAGRGRVGEELSKISAGLPAFMLQIKPSNKKPTNPDTCATRPYRP